MLRNRLRHSFLLLQQSDLTFALDYSVKEFRGKYPATKVNVTYGVSEHFFSQLETGAPFDLFFSADMAYPRESLLRKAWLLMTFPFTQSARGKLWRRARPN